MIAGDTPQRPAAELESKPSTRAADSSVTIAAILADDVLHDAAERALADSERTIAHVAAETYSVLTRIAPPLRLDADTAAAILEQRLPPQRVTLDADQHATAIRRLADARISGGATYDGLIALTALEYGIELISRDRRAARTYHAIGVRFQLID